MEQIHRMGHSRGEHRGGAGGNSAVFDRFHEFAKAEEGVRCSRATSQLQVAKLSTARPPWIIPYHNDTLASTRIPITGAPVLS